MKVTKSNNELLLLLQKDDRVAFYNLYERYSKRLYGFVLQYVKRDADAEEIVQEVFIKIWEKEKQSTPILPLNPSCLPLPKILPSACYANG